MKTLLRIRTIAVTIPVVLALVACAPGRKNEPEPVRAKTDIHERLAAAILRDGFSHSLYTQRERGEDHDVIRITISLDSLKGRHLSLEKLMKDISTICAHPNYAHLPIHILIEARDDDDQTYLYALLTSIIKAGANIAIDIAADAGNMVTIRVRHPAQVGG